MTAKYATLEGGKDWLGGEGGARFNTDRAGTAQREADDYIDQTFHAYDRSTWLPSTGTVPPEIRTIALKYGSAEYQRLNFTKASSLQEAPQLSKDLFSEARGKAEEMVSRGYVLLADGTRQYPADTLRDAGTMFPTINAGSRTS